VGSPRRGCLDAGKVSDIGGIPSVFGVLQNGQMVKLHEFHGLRNGQAFVVEPRQVEESAKSWQEWCSGMDGLGTLIMLAATLPTS
jgi:hypothetical protein